MKPKKQLAQQTTISSLPLSKKENKSLSEYTSNLLSKKDFKDFTLQTVSLLKQHKLKKTEVRVQVLNCFLTHSYALGSTELELLITKNLDRVTLYRTLKVFEKSGLIHPVIKDDGTTLYAPCLPEQCKIKHEHDNHIHFQCKLCRKTFCLNDLVTPKIISPQGFIIEKVNLKATGVCDSCNSV